MVNLYFFQLRQKVNLYLFTAFFPNKNTPGKVFPLYHLPYKSSCLLGVAFLLVIIIVQKFLHIIDGGILILSHGLTGHPHGAGITEICTERAWTHGTDFDAKGSKFLMQGKRQALRLGFCTPSEYNFINFV